MHKYLLPLFAVLLVFGCAEDSDETHRKTKPVEPKVQTPAFNADSAYAFIQQQVDFGPRVPNTQPHKDCGNWLEDKLREYGADVIVQEDIVYAWDDTPLEMKNIIGQYAPEKKKRVMLYAHWDTRPYADKDSVRTTDPIDGANDGGSGVGVLLEVARQLSMQPTDVGIDIVFFDTEDYGPPEWKSDEEDDYLFWCLGSQYWTKNKHVTGYRAKYGILLDMVGGKDAVFNREGMSVAFAPNVVDHIWRTARRLGYGNLFRDEVTPQTIDDNYFVSNFGGVPSANIVEYHVDVNPQVRTMGYGMFHHTHKDDMSIIDTATLKAVGETVMEVIYLE